MCVCVCVCVVFTHFKCSWSKFHAYLWCCNFLIGFWTFYKGYFATYIILKSGLLRGNRLGIPVPLYCRWHTDKTLFKISWYEQFYSLSIITGKKLPILLTCHLVLNHKRRFKDFWLIIQNIKTFVLILKYSNKWDILCS